MTIAQYAGGSQTGATNPTYTTTAPLPSAALGIIFYAQGGNSRAPTAISDGTNSYTQVATYTDPLNQLLTVWRCANCTAVGSGATITVTQSSGGGQAGEQLIALYDTAGALTTPEDVSSNGTSTTSSLTAGTTATTTQSSELVTAMFYNLWTGGSSGGTIGSLATGYTATTETDVANGGTQYSLIVGYKQVSAVGTQTATATESPGAGETTARGSGLIVTFKEVAAGATIGHIPTHPTVPLIPTVGGM